LASDSPDGTIKIWNTVTGSLIKTLDDHFNGHFSLAISLVVLPGGTLASGYFDSIKIWDIDNAIKITTLSDHKSWIMF